MPISKIGKMQSISYVALRLTRVKSARSDGCDAGTWDLAHLLFVNNVSLRDFYVRRISRAFPALWLFVFAMLAMTYVFGKFGVTLHDAFHALTFTVNYTARPEVFEHIWSLCIEEHSYVALSLIALWSRRRPINVVALLAVLAIAGILNGVFQTWYLGHDYFSVY